MLLRFPHLPPPEPLMCGLGVIGDSVEDYIWRLDNLDLVEALILDPNADGRCLRSAIRRLLSLGGVRATRAVIARRRADDPALLTRPDLALVARLLASPHAWIKVASIDKEKVSNEAAGRVLAGFKADLERGTSWKLAYRRAADLLPNVARSATFVGYMFDGPIDPTGFDVQYMGTRHGLFPEHVRQVFAAKRGTHVLESWNAYWLYHIESFDE